MREVDLPHAARAEEGNDLVGAQARAGREAGLGRTGLFDLAALADLADLTALADLVMGRVHLPRVGEAKGRHLDRRRCLVRRLVLRVEAPCDLAAERVVVAAGSGQ